jgi:mRNA-degrading endonuclease RelE of RelBE toxin-antitoxin system
MSGSSKFSIFFAPETLDHLDAIERKYHRFIRKTINEQLSRTPDQVTRNRKPCDPPMPFGATWELRFGPKNRFRVFYEVDTDTRSVSILAVGIKEGNRLLISREEYTS